VTVVAGVASGGGRAGRVVEYCKWETFNASCRSPDHVIAMTAARYGRMRFGRYKPTVISATVVAYPEGDQ